jgi:hypothetical protein
MNAIIDSYISREGYHQQLIYRYDGKAIYLSGSGESYVRAAILMGIKEICIYALNDGKMMSVSKAREMKQDMLDCLGLDYATKRGRKPAISIKVISPIGGMTWQAGLARTSA